MPCVKLPANAFRYKLIHSFFNVFLKTNNYLLIKDACFGSDCTAYDMNAVDLVKKMSRLYSLIFYSDISDGFKEEVNDYNYVFKNNVTNDRFIAEIFNTGDLCYAMSKLILMTSYTPIDLMVLYYYLIIKKLSNQCGYYIRLPLNIMFDIQNEIKGNELMNIRYYLEGKLQKYILEEKAEDLSVGGIEKIYRSELSAYKGIITKISLFGSLIREEYTKDSDIDLIVYLNKASVKCAEKIKNAIKSINIIKFNRKSDIHIAYNEDACGILFEGDSYDVYL